MPRGRQEGILAQIQPLCRCAAPAGETLLTLAGYYVGREFKFAGIRAVWTASQGQIKFYGDDGEMLRVVEVGELQKRVA